MGSLERNALSKVPAITLGFWMIKILATTLGETTGDAVSMSWLGETIAQAGQGGARRDQRIPHRVCNFRHRSVLSGCHSDQGAAVPPVSLLGDHYCIDNRRHDDG